MANENAAAQNAYIHAINAAKATQQQSNAAAANTKQLAINSAQQAQLLGDSGAEAAYQVQLNSFAKTQATSDAAASLTLSLAINGALATQSTADTATGNTYAHAMNDLTKQYSLDMGDANAAKMKAEVDAYSVEQVAINNAAASAWTGSGAYNGAYEAATYTYNAAVAAITGPAWSNSIDAQNQWAHDVSGGWLTYRNDLADHAATAAGTMTAAATALTNAIATNANTFATTVAPAIQAAADAEVNNGFAAIQSGASAAQTYASDTAADALASTEAEILAVQTLNDTGGDNAEQKVVNDSAAGGILAAIAASLIGQLPDPAPAADASKDEFTEKLRGLVEKAGLHRNVQSLGQNEVENGPPGFDCDDFADVLQRFLYNNFTRDTVAKVSILTAHWVRPPTPANLLTGRNAGHAFLVVERDGKYWLVNPVLGLVEGVYVDMDAVKIAAIGHVNLKYDVDPDFPVTIGGPYADHAAFRKGEPGEPEAWHTSPAMRQRFADFLRIPKKEPKNYFPRGVIIPAPIDRSQPPYFNGPM